MPELPEVETIRRGLLTTLPGRTVSRVTVTMPKLVVSHTGQELAQDLLGQSFREVRRVGKILILDLERTSLLLRLGMTGQVTFRDLHRADDNSFYVHAHTGLQRANGQFEPDKHTHIIVEHNDDTMLCYRDIRRFGRWIAYKRNEVDTCPELLALGPDPISHPEVLESQMRRALAKTSRSIKVVLLDQAVICGLGNIYVDEALFSTGICPSRPARSLSSDEIARLAAFIPDMLARAIDNRGTTFSDYRDSEGNPGNNQSYLQVYGRYGKECLKCGAVLERICLGGRTTTWCPKCQH